MSHLLESKLDTRIGTVVFKIDLTGLSKEMRLYFREVKMLGPSSSLGVDNINTLEELALAMETGLRDTKFISHKAILEMNDRLEAFGEWLAQMDERGAKNIIVKARTFIGMSTLERKRRMKLMGI